MKKNALLLIVFMSFGQMMHPAKWTFKSEGIKDGEAELIFTVKLDPEWHIYSQYTPDGGPLPMLFKFDSSECYTLIGKVSEPKPIELYDSLFGIKVFFLEKEAVLKQKIKFKGNSCIVKGSISYQACKEMCIALDTTFVIKIGRGKDDKSQLPVNSPVQGSISPVNPGNTPVEGIRQTLNEIFIHSSL